MTTTALLDDVAHFTQLFGPSGHEDLVIAEFTARVRALGFEPTIDPLGNVIVRAREADAGWPTFGVAAHLDEIGFVVADVEDDGRVRLNRLGGVSDKVMAGQVLRFRSDTGETVEGHVAVKSAHLTTADEQAATTKVEEARVDLLLSAPEEAAELGIRPGVPGTFVGPFHRRGDLIRAKALDDRAGLAILLDLLRRVADLPPGPGVCVIATVQEEFLLRGGIPAALAAAPDVLLCVDISPATDPAQRDRGGPRVGAGPVVHRFSRGRSGGGLVPNPRLAAYITDVAAGHEIPLSHHTLDGGLTDGSYMQLAGPGIQTLDLTFAVYNAHTAVEVASMTDIALLADLLDAAIRDASKGLTFARG